MPVAELLLGRCGRVFGEYQIANQVRERETVNGHNYLIFNICDLNSINVKTEPSICMKIWQSDNLNEELYDGLQEDNARIRLTGVNCTLYQNTPQLTLKGDFSDGRVQLINGPSVPCRSMLGNELSFSSSRMGHRRASSLSPHQIPHIPTRKSCLSDSISASNNAEAKRVNRVHISDSDIKEPDTNFPFEIKDGSQLTKKFIFGQGIRMGLSLKPEKYMHVAARGDQFSALGIGARVSNFERDSSLIGMVIYDVNGDSTFRHKPLREINRLLSQLTGVIPLVVTFGPAASPDQNSNGLPSSTLSSTEKLLASQCTLSSQESSHIQQISGALPPVSPLIPTRPGKSELPGFKTVVESLKKRVELLEGKTSVRKLSVDQLEDLLENAESLTTRVRRELAKRAQTLQPECSVCLNAKPNQTFVPCGHCVCCEECASNLEVCPLCRKKITQKVKSFFS